MQAVQDIEQAIARLSSDELAGFRAWFEEFDAGLWEKQFKRDAASGKLDKLADRAVADFRSGSCTKL